MNAADSRGRALRAQSLRVSNEQLVLDCIRAGPPLTRAELATQTSLTPQALGPILNHLAERGLVVERRRSSVGLGRPPTEYLIDPVGSVRVSAVIRFADVVVVISDAVERVIATGHLRHTAGDRPTGLVRRVFDRIDAMLLDHQIERDRLASVTMAVEGWVDSERRVVYETPAWRRRDVDLGAVAERFVGESTVVTVLSRDQALATEALGQAGADDSELVAIVQVGHDNYLFMASGGEVLTGGSGRTGSLAHLPVIGNDKLCHCGRVGCFGTVSSGRAVVEVYAERTGERLPAAIDVIDRVADRDPDAIEAVRSTIDWLGRGLGPLLDVFAPDRIVLTGAVGAEGGRGVEHLKTSLRRHLERPDVPIHVAHPAFTSRDLTRDVLG